ncbi:hypothetical protein [Bradyrhizobium sp. F1.13.3]|uniref:hypothetical protein n=1 Tax=Bradyrhizobium sp. F1.13.3 TaxID=3156351 RepID=UPI00339A9F3D
MSEKAPELKLVEELDQDEIEFNRLRCDLPGSAGTAAQGIVSIAVSKTPTKNEFFRTHPTFRPDLKLVNIEVGMEKQYFAVAPDMEVPLHGIGINFSKYTLYLTMSPGGAFHVIPIMVGSDNDYNRSKEYGLLDGVKRWVRLYTDQENKQYRVFPAPEGRFDEPQWPDLSVGKIGGLCFRDKGRLIDSTSHELFKKWAARDR